MVESYLYGQIHIDKLDDGEDRFTTNRENIIVNDPIYSNFLEQLKEVVQAIFDDWDKWRLEIKGTGDPENPRLSRRERYSQELFNAVAEDYIKKREKESAEDRKRIETWVDSLGKDAQFNFGSYADCFISENLIRIYIKNEKIPCSKEARGRIDEMKKREEKSKADGNISIDLRESNDDFSYLNMNELANLVDKTRSTRDLVTDSKQYKPIRDALMHTALLTEEAKRKLTTVYENIKGRVVILISTETK